MLVPIHAIPDRDQRYRLLGCAQRLVRAERLLRAERALEERAVCFRLVVVDLRAGGVDERCGPGRGEEVGVYGRGLDARL